MARTKTVVRPAPQEQQVPTGSPRSTRHSLRNLIVGILTIGVVILVAVALAAIFSLREDPAVQPFDSAQGKPEQQVQIGPAPVENPPVQDTTQATPEVELQWTKVGTERRNGDEKKLPLPWDRIFFISWPEVQTELKFTESASNGGWSGYGDGTAFFLTNWHGEYRFTPDRGMHWFKPANLYPGTSSTLPELHGALLEGNTLVLYIALQSEPWVYTYWRAESPLVTLEGLSR